MNEFRTHGADSAIDDELEPIEHHPTDAGMTTEPEMAGRALLELAKRCDERVEAAADQAIDCELGGRGSMEWIQEAANYATVAAALRARAHATLADRGGAL